MPPASISPSPVRASPPPGKEGKAARPFDRALAAAQPAGRTPREERPLRMPLELGEALERSRAAGADGPVGAVPGVALRVALLPPTAEGVAALRAAVRAFPPAIVATPLRDGAQLALNFGALGVELRAGAQGLELALRPAAPLADAARAELPGLVAALRASGIKVARAEVRPWGGRSGGASGPPPRNAR